MPDVLRLYIAENGTRTLVKCFSAKWVAGQDIDCFEAITSTEEVLNGKFAKVWNTAWNSYTNMPWH